MKEMKATKRHILSAMAVGAAVFITLCGCSSTRIGRTLSRRPVSISLVDTPSSAGTRWEGLPIPDTLLVHDDEGREQIIMRAVRDEDGEMVAQDVLKAAYVQARFRHVAEREGLVRLEFLLRVPGEIVRDDWQLRFRPVLTLLGDTLSLDRVYLTGKDFRRSQLRGYERYERFLSSIVEDTTLLVNRWQLELFIQRNIPELYSLRRDSSVVDAARFESIFGVNEREAIEHYTRAFLVRRNSRRIQRKASVFSRNVRVPLGGEGIRIDTVPTPGEDFIYTYSETIRTRPGLRKAEITLDGSIYDSDRRIYDIPMTSPLTYYISSLSSFADTSIHYRKVVLERVARENTACYIEFEKGSSRVDPLLGNNPSEMGRIENNLRSLLTSEVFEVDSILVGASCSPEGSYHLNRNLSRERSLAVGRYFENFVSSLRDSLSRERGVVMGLGDEDVPGGTSGESAITFLSRPDPENWRMLDRLVEVDSTLSPSEKRDYFLLGESLPGDLDLREERLSARPYYRYLRERLYPRLRVVRFEFFLHRRGMVKDTLSSTVVDREYMGGVSALLSHDYRGALDILRPYRDFNCALAYCALGYNASALEILGTLPRDERVDYMLALIYSRRGEVEKAMEYFLSSCRKNPSFVHRGNLDPEISSLLRQFPGDELDRILDGE